MEVERRPDAEARRCQVIHETNLDRAIVKLTQQLADRLGRRLERSQIIRQAVVFRRTWQDRQIHGLKHVLIRPLLRTPDRSEGHEQRRKDRGNCGRRCRRGGRREAGAWGGRLRASHGARLRNAPDRSNDVHFAVPVEHPQGPTRQVVGIGGTLTSGGSVKD